MVDISCHSLTMKILIRMYILNLLHYYNVASFFINHHPFLQSNSTIYVCVIKCILLEQTAPHILWPMIWSIDNFRSASLLRQGNTQQSDTPKYMHIVCIRIFTYIRNQLDLVIVEMITLAGSANQCCFSIGFILLV